MADNVTMNVHLSFFSLGGNSLSAIQLLFALRAELQAVINIPELFAQSSLASLIALVESRTDASAAHSAPVAVNTKYKIMQLWTSNSNKASSGCLVLFNPAGASGLCYMDFVNALSQINQDRISRVLVLDDGAVSEGTPFTFTSILEVAVHAVEVLQKHELTRDLLGREDHQLHLGGWSYGGVVAFEVAKRLCSTFHICPQGLYLFDAPLQGEVVSEVKSEVHTFESRKFSQNPGDEVSQRSSQHFAQCTDLLRQYHKHISRGLITTPPCNLNCKIVDFRPRELEDGSPIPEDTIRSNCDYLNEVCSGDLGTISTVVNGSHWTILEGDNAFHIATIVIDNAQ
jgi:acyl carrier protein